jgi:hypothetical protein
MIFQETIRIKGLPVQRDAVRINNQTYIIFRKFLKTASLKKQWHEDVQNPDQVIQALKNSPVRIDLFKFWQRIPETDAKFNYYKEQRDIAAIPVITFDRWWNKQINTKTRNMVRKTQKMGVRVEEMELSDEFVRGVMDIYNQSPVRRGKPFWHYGKDFATIKDELSADLEQSIFIVAHHKKELIGFIKLLLADRYAMITLILDKMAHRDKAPMNGMIAKAVEICAQRGIPYITYTVWRRGEHGQFQKRNGFEKMFVPEYFVPLTIKGWLALRLGLHKGLIGALPEKVIVWLLALRSKWYSTRYPQTNGLPLTERKSVTSS